MEFTRDRLNYYYYYDNCCLDALNIICIVIRACATARHHGAEGQTISRENTVQYILLLRRRAPRWRGGVYIIIWRIVHFRDEPCCADRYYTVLNIYLTITYRYTYIIIYNIEVGNPSSVAAYALILLFRFPRVAAVVTATYI